MSLPIEIVNDFYLEVVRGNVSGFAAREIVGMNTAIGGTFDVWNQGVVAGSHEQIVQVATAALLYVSSTSAGDITQTVTITGLDANYDEITESIHLNASSGRTRVAGTKAFLRVNGVTLSAACAGKVYVYYYCDITTGTPDDLSLVQAAVDIAALQAYNAIYTVPRNKTMYLTGLRYASTGSTTTNDVIISVLRKVYGGSIETVKEIKYVDAGGTVYTDEQVQLTDRPVEFPAKSEFRITAGLAGGTALNLSVLATCVEETTEVVSATVDLMNKTDYLAFLATESHTIASVTYYLIGLDEEPVSTPSTAALGDLLTTITGATNYTVAADTDVVFDPAYYVSGKLVITNKKAILTIMRCVDNHPMVKYVLAPVNTVVNIRNAKKISYLHD
jgi:hypothetical protein